jgi:hypothetical protein
VLLASRLSSKRRRGAKEEEGGGHDGVRLVFGDSTLDLRCRTARPTPMEIFLNEIKSVGSSRAKRRYCARRCAGSFWDLERSGLKGRQLPVEV